MRRAPLLAVVGLVACAAPPPVDEVLGGSDEDLDRLVRASVAAADAAPADGERQIAAAAALFQAADRRLQRATLAWLAANPQAGLAAVLAADDAVDDGARQAVQGLAAAGRAFAERALQYRADDPQAKLQLALHLVLVAWAEGPARAVLGGTVGSLTAAIEASVAATPELDGGAPLRLQGRFLGKAPWPYGDLARAREALQRAVAIRGLPVNHLFLGDVLAAAGDLDGARRQWGLVERAEADAATRWSAAELRELARRRLAAAH